MKKIWLFGRIFLSLLLSLFFITGFVLYFSYFFTEKIYIDNVKKNIYSQFETIKTFININNQDVFSLPIWQVKQLDKVGMFTNIEKSNFPIKTIFTKQQDVVFFQTYYNGYNIIIWKKLIDLGQIRYYYFQTWIKILFFVFIISILISYFLTKFVLSPFDNIILFLKNYNLWDKKTLQNNYKWTDIWFLIDNINNFINQINKTYLQKQELVEQISHQLKTPLMQIQSSLDLIELNIKDQQDLEKIEQIRQIIENMSKTIAQLNFIQQENYNLKKEEISLYELINSIFLDLSSLIKRKNLKIDIKWDKKVFENKELLHTLFENLILNAILYNKENWKIEVFLNENKVVIKDTWKGIKNTEKVFEKFYRESDLENGTWLGLSIVKKIIENLWWEIEIKSKVGEGTEVLIKFD